MPSRPLLSTPFVVALLGVLLTSLALPGCFREVILGPAGEPSGRHLPTWLHFTIETDTIHADLARALAVQFGTVGVRAGVRVLGREEIIARALAGKSDACLVAWSGPSADPLGLAAAKLTPGAAENLSGYAEPEIGLLLAGILGRRTEAGRQDCARAAQEFLYEEAPWVFGLTEPLYDASAAALTGWVAGPGGAVSLHDASLTVDGERVTVGLGVAERPTLDPLRPIDAQTRVIFRCLFDALATVGPDGALLPELAEGWDWSRNGRELTVRLRSGVTFHNGARLTAKDVAFTYAKVLPGRVPPTVAVNVAAVDSSTVVFTFSAPFLAFLDIFGLQPVVPAAYYEAVGAEGFAAAPVGTGPFRLDPDRRSRQMLLVRWERYYGGCPALPPAGQSPLSEVAFSLVPEAAERLAMLKSGQIVLAPALPAWSAEAYRQASGARVVPEPGRAAVALELNNRRPPFDDARVRLALNLALDRQTLVQPLGSDVTLLLTAFFPEGFGFSAEAGGFVADPARARTLLREAGYLVTEG